MKASCIGARISSAPPVDILPRHKPYLHKIQPKDPIELENGGYVSSCEYNMTSAMRCRPVVTVLDRHSLLIGDDSHTAVPAVHVFCAMKATKSVLLTVPLR